MVDFGKSGSAKKLDSILPAIQLKLTTHGGVMRRDEIEKLYGRQLIALAVNKGHVKSITVIRKKPDARSIKFSVICNEHWDRISKPEWME